MSSPLLKYYIGDSKLLRSSNFSTSNFPDGKILYEIIRVIDGVPIFLEEHISRLLTSVIESKSTSTIDRATIAKTLHLLISQNKLSIGNIRFQIIVSDSTNMFFAWIVPHKYPSRELYEMGVKTETINIERINPNIKAFDSKLKDQLDEIRKQNNLYELLLIDGNMNVTEGSKSNIFFIKGTTLYSPPLNQVLPGITRKMIIKIAKENDIEFVEKVITLNDLNSFASVFLSGTSPKILPINRINNHTYQTKNDIMSLISKSYNKTLDEYVTSFKWSNYE